MPSLPTFTAVTSRKESKAISGIISAMVPQIEQQFYNEKINTLTTVSHIIIIFLKSFINAISKKIPFDWAYLFIRTRLIINVKLWKKCKDFSQIISSWKRWKPITLRKLSLSLKSRIQSRSLKEKRYRYW